MLNMYVLALMPFFNISWRADGRLSKQLGLPSIKIKEPCKNRATFQRRPSIYVFMLCCIIYVFHVMIDDCFYYLKQ